MADIKLKDGTIATVISTGLNSLADAARAISGAIDNSTALDLWADFELDVTFGAAPTEDLTCELYLVQSMDDTNYEDGDATIVPKTTKLIGLFVLRAVTTAQLITINRVDIPPRNFKVILANKSGQAFPASGSTVKIRPYKLQSV